MSNNQDNNKSNNIEPKFNELQAYEELRLIFAIAIETQNLESLEANIAVWEQKYPLADFTDEDIIRKIKAILNKDFLSRLLGDYLAEKILREEEKQKELYDSLKAVIDNAKKTKDYKTAQKEIRKWKEKLHEKDFNLYSFNRLYRARVCTLLLLPSKELENQEQATDELKRLKENGNSMSSDEYFAAISNWQNTYSISDFPDKLKQELNKITSEVFDSIAQKRTSENAISEIEGVLSSKDIPLPADTIASILAKYDSSHFDEETTERIKALTLEALAIQESTLNDGIPNIDLSILPYVSPTESQALASLRDIMLVNAHDMDAILNWIYLNRKINYSEFAREKIIKQFFKAGYEIPIQNSYSIPEITSNLDYRDFSKIDDIRKNVILNYLGIISQGNTLSIEGKDNLIEAHSVSTQSAVIQEASKPTMFLESFETIVEQPKTEEKKTYDNKGEEEIYNIFIEDIIDNPLVTYSISTSSKEDKAQSPVIDEKSTTSSTIELVEDTKNEPTETSSNSNSKYTLTIQDEENLEQAYEASTYIVVASPILAQSLEHKHQHSRRKMKDIERIK